MFAASLLLRNDNCGLKEKEGYFSLGVRLDGGSVFSGADFFGDWLVGRLCKMGVGLSGTWTRLGK